METVREEQIHSEWNWIEHQQVKQSRGPKIIPKVVNLCMFKSINKHNMVQFRRVTEVKPNDIVFVTRDGKHIARPIRIVSPILQTTGTNVGTLTKMEQNKQLFSYFLIV